MELFKVNGGNISIKRPNGTVVLDSSKGFVTVVGGSNHWVVSGGISPLQVSSSVWLKLNDSYFSTIHGCTNSFITLPRNSVVARLPVACTSIPLVYINLKGALGFPDTFIPIHGSMVLQVATPIPSFTNSNFSTNVSYLYTVSVFYDNVNVYVRFRSTFGFLSINQFYLPGWKSFSASHPFKVENSSQGLISHWGTGNGVLVCHDTAIPNLEITIKEIAW